MKDIDEFDESMITKIYQALLKKTMGYRVKETSIEYSVGEDEENKKIKKKVVTKHIPCDINAAKVLMDLLDKDNFKELDLLSDEELENEKLRLINLLKTTSEKSNEQKGDNDEIK